jgi:hypothetical protein
VAKVPLLADEDGDEPSSPAVARYLEDIDAQARKHGAAECERARAFWAKYDAQRAQRARRVEAVPA